MEFRALLPKRRMVRHYAPEPIPRETVERIVETVRRAPSAGYSQGQRLNVMTGDAALNATATVLLVTGWLLIKRRRIPQHRAVMIAAVITSAAGAAAGAWLLGQMARSGAAPWTSGRNP